MHKLGCSSALLAVNAAACGTPLGAMMAAKLVLTLHVLLACRLMGKNWPNRARLSETDLETLLELPGTRGMQDFVERTNALTQWKMALQRG